VDELRDPYVHKWGGLPDPLRSSSSDRQPDKETDSTIGDKQPLDVTSERRPTNVNSLDAVDWTSFYVRTPTDVLYFTQLTL